MAMTHKERIDAAFHQQPTDRVPFGFVDGGAWIAKSNGLTYRELYGSPDGGAALIVKYTDEADVDFVSGVNGVFTAPLNAYGCPIQIDESGTPPNTGACLKKFEEEIPALDKTKIRETLMANEFFSNMVKQCGCINKLVGDRKYIIGDIAGPYTLASVMAGTAKFMKLMMKKQDLCQQLLDFTTELCIEIYRILGENGCNIAFIAEPVAAGDMLRPDMFDKWVAPGIAKVKAALMDCGYKYVIQHICGASGVRVTPLRDLGVDAFSCDFAVDLDQSLTDADGKMTIMGNMLPSGKLLFGTADEVYEEACERIKIAAGRPYVLAPGCDLGADTPYDNVMAMSRAIKETQK